MIKCPGAIERRAAEPIGMRPAANADLVTSEDSLTDETKAFIIHRVPATLPIGRAQNM